MCFPFSFNLATSHLTILHFRGQSTCTVIICKGYFDDSEVYENSTEASDTGEYV